MLRSELLIGCINALRLFYYKWISELVNTNPHHSRVETHTLVYAFGNKSKSLVIRRKTRFAIWFFSSLLWFSLFLSKSLLLKWFLFKNHQKFKTFSLESPVFLILDPFSEFVSKSQFINQMKVDSRKSTAFNILD